MASCVARCAGLGPGRDLRGTTEEQRASMEYIQSPIDAMGILDASVLGVPSIPRSDAPSLCRRKNARLNGG
jgi:hypothetical protein